MSAEAAPSSAAVPGGDAQADAESWWDVTAVLQSAGPSLPVGHFLCTTGDEAAGGPPFSLHSAMSALELLDARMDAGMALLPERLRLQRDNRVASAEQQRFWDDRRLLLICDALLCCFATHLSGVSLPHSLYTFVLLHQRPYEPQQQDEEVTSGAVFPLLHPPLLSLVSRLLLHAAHACRSVVSRADLYEEEEWSSHDFGLRIEQRGGGEEMQREATEMEESMEREIKAMRVKQPAAGSETERRLADRASLLSRLRLSHSLFLLLHELSRPQLKARSASKLLSRAVSQLLTIATSPLLSSAESSSGGGYYAELSAFLSSPSCPFDSSITSSLILHAPPRTYALLSLQSSLSLLHQLLHHLGLVLSVPSLQSLPALLSFLSHFAEQQPNIVARSLLLSACQSEDNVCQSSRSLQQLIQAAIEEFSPSSALFFLPAVRSRLADAAAAVDGPSSAAPPPELFPQLLSHLSAFYAGQFRLLLMDRNKQRKRLTQQLQLLSRCQQQADNVDQWMLHLARNVDLPMADEAAAAAADDDRRRVCSSGFHSFVYDASCSCLLHFVTVGLRSSLFCDAELQLLYWLAHHWAALRISNRERAWRDPRLVPLLVSRHITRQGQQTQQQQATARKKERAALSSLASAPPFSCDWAVLDVLSLMSSATVALIRGLSDARQPAAAEAAVQVPSFPPAFLSTYFPARFSFVSALESPRLTAADYVQQMQQEFAPERWREALSIAGGGFQRAKEAISKTAKIAAAPQQQSLAASTVKALALFSQQTANAAAASSPAPASASPPPPVQDLSRTLLSVDPAFLRSLLTVCVANAVTAATVSKSIGSAAGPLRARFSFDACPLFPVITVEAARQQREGDERQADGVR